MSMSRFRISSVCFSTRITALSAALKAARLNSIYSFIPVGAPAADSRLVFFA